MRRVEWLDGLAVDEARRRLEYCCGAARWVDAMLAKRPFGSEAALLAAADAAFARLGREDWLEAFRHHPQIGDLASLKRRFAATAALAATEQAGVRDAAAATLAELAAGNAAYEAKFGYIFIVCATGKSAAEMLGILQARLAHAPDFELGVAAAEQKKITRIRLATTMEASA
jgi:2-oxo-4-hydroxy-4-carboxy-5-ureidoimidazoline decarboxylase